MKQHFDDCFCFAPASTMSLVYPPKTALAEKPLVHDTRSCATRSRPRRRSSNQMLGHETQKVTRQEPERWTAQTETLLLQCCFACGRRSAMLHAKGATLASVHHGRRLPPASIACFEDGRVAIELSTTLTLIRERGRREDTYRSHAT